MRRAWPGLMMPWPEWKPAHLHARLTITVTPASTAVTPFTTSDLARDMDGFLWDATNNKAICSRGGVYSVGINAAVQSITATASDYMLFGVRVNSGALFQCLIDNIPISQFFTKSSEGSVLLSPGDSVEFVCAVANATTYRAVGSSSSWLTSLHLHQITRK